MTTLNSETVRCIFLVGQYAAFANMNTTTVCVQLLVQYMILSEHEILFLSPSHIMSSNQV